MASRPRDLDYLSHLAHESDRFADVMATTTPGARVPPCRDWTADDLLWHLGEVQWFWGTVVREGVDGDAAEARKPDRPAGRADLAAFYGSASKELRAALAAAPPEASAWTWSDEQTVGFIRRRQAHEALIHRVDAEVTARDRTAMDPELSADGIDEALRIMYGDWPDWGTVTPAPGHTLRLDTTDTGDSWLVVLGRFAGTSPSGKSYDEPCLEVVDSGAPAATIAATAADLDCWLWNRPTFGQVECLGEQSVLDGFNEVRAAGIE